MWVCLSSCLSLFLLFMSPSLCFSLFAICSCFKPLSLWSRCVVYVENVDVVNHSFYNMLCTFSLFPSFFSSSSSSPVPPPFELDYLCFPGEWEGAFPPFWGSHPGHTGPPAVQHTEARGTQRSGSSGGSRRVRASDYGGGRLCRQLHPNRHQLPAYVDPGQEQPASLWSSTPTRPSAIPSTTTVTGAIFIQ